MKAEKLGSDQVLFLLTDGGMATLSVERLLQFWRHPDDEESVVEKLLN